MPNKRFVFLGGAGFIGYHLAKAFSEDKSSQIIIIDNLIRGTVDNLLEELCSKENVTYVNADICNMQDLLQLIHPRDIVFNLVALNGTQNFYNKPMQVIWNTGNSAIVAAEVCAQKKVAKYVYFGSSEAYAGSVQLGIAKIPTPENVPFVFPDSSNLRWSYGMSKAIGEATCWAINHESGIDFTIIRVHNVYGPRMGLEHVIPDLITKFLAGDMTVYGLTETRSFIYVDDFVSLTQAVYQKPEFQNIVVNIGNDEEITIAQLSSKINSLLSLDKPIIDAGNILGSVARRCPDLSLVKSEVKFELTSLEEGLERTIAYYLEFPPGRMPYKFGGHP